MLQRIVVLRDPTIQTQQLRVGMLHDGAETRRGRGFRAQFLPSLGIGRGVALSACDDDAARGSGGEVDGFVASAGVEQEFEVREMVEELGGEGRTFSHRGDDLVRFQAFGELVQLGGLAGIQGFRVGVDFDALDLGEEFWCNSGVVVDDCKTDSFAGGHVGEWFSC